MSNPPNAPYPQPRRSGAVGCLGVFAVFSLLLMTAANAAAVWWLDPQWFDNLAWWRGQRYEPEIAFVDGSKLPRTPPDVRPVVQNYPRLPAAPVVLSESRTSARNDPARGATVQSPLGATLEVSPNAVREAADVSLAPITDLPASMNAPIVGQVYELKIGARDSYSFNAPVKLTVPYVPELCPDGATLAVWENGRWVPVPSRFDAANGVVVGELRHASIYTVLGIGRIGLTGKIGAPLLPIIALMGLTGRGRGMAFNAWYGRSDTYTSSSGNFRIHYYLTGDHAVPTDAQYDLSKGRTRSAGARAPPPLYIEDIAILLESCHAGLNKSGFPFPQPWKDNNNRGWSYEVFVVKLDAFGESPLAGPLFISSKLQDQAKEEAVDFDALMRATIVHEMTHVIQDEYFHLAEASYYRWWIECSAAYVGDWYWSPSGLFSSQPTDLVRTYYGRGKPKYIAKAIDAGTSEKEMYPWGALMTFMDERYNGAGVNFVKAVHAGKSMSLSSLDAACRSATGKALGEALAEFARDVYHDDLWKAKTYPDGHKQLSPYNQALEQSSATEDFTVVRAIQPKTAIPVRNDWAMYSASRLPHLSAQCYPMIVQQVEERHKAKLYVAAKAFGAINPDMDVMISTGLTGAADLPAKGAAEPWQRVGLSTDRVQMVFPINKKTDRVTIVAVNKSLDKELAAPQLERWLLMPPLSCNAQRQATGAAGASAAKSSRWKVRWTHVDLRDHPPIFSGYKVYARKSSEPAAMLKHIVSVTEDWAEWTAPDDDTYAFVVKTLDKYGNESEGRESEYGDPFDGHWYGKIYLAEGQFADPIIASMKESAAKEEQKALARIAAAPPSSRAEAQKRYTEDKKIRDEFMQLMEKLVHGAEQLARLGIPVQMKITPRGEDYELRVLKVLGQDLDQKTDDNLFVLLRTPDPHLLAFREQPKNLPRVEFRVYRENHARELDYKGETTIDNKPQKFTLKWVFYRPPPGE